MQFMVIEHFNDGDPRPVYRRFNEKGRMCPEGLTFVDSWVDAGFGRCFVLVECDEAALLTSGARLGPTWSTSKSFPWSRPAKPAPR